MPVSFLVIFYRACKWNKQKVHRIPLAKGTSWELVVTSMQIILISQWKFESCKQNAHADVAHVWMQVAIAAELLQSCLLKAFKDLSSKRFSFYKKSIRPSFSW